MATAQTDAHSNVSKRLTVVMIVGALFTAVVMAGLHGYAKASHWLLAIPMVTALVCVAIGEVLAWHNAACGWHERRPGSMVLWGTLGCLLTMGVLYTNFSVGAGNNETKASFQTSALTTRGDIDKAVKEQEREVTRLEERLKLQPKRTAEAARVDQDNAKAHRYWQATDQCTKTLGPATRKFCDAYRSAQADESLANAALVDREDLKVAQKKLDTLRQQRAAAPAVLSPEQPQVQLVAHFIRADARSDDQAAAAEAAAWARQFDAMVLPTLIQVMLAFGGICLANELYRHRARIPWVDVDKWLRRAALSREVIAGRRGLKDYVPPATNNATAAAAGAPTALVPVAGQTVEQHHHHFDPHFAECIEAALGPIARRAALPAAA